MPLFGGIVCLDGLRTNDNVSVSALHVRAFIRNSTRNIASRYSDDNRQAGQYYQEPEKCPQNERFHTAFD